MDFKKVEEKWKDVWEREKHGVAEDFSGEKFYCHLIITVLKWLSVKCFQILLRV